MPDQYLTLKDATAARGTDAAVGIVDNIINNAPEMGVVLGRPIAGIEYKALIRTAIPANAGFRKVNSGVPLGASSYDRKRFNCYPFDMQFRIDQMLVEAQEAEGQTAADFMTAELMGASRAKALYLGKQFYVGTANDPLGFPGLLDFFTTSRTQADSRTGRKIDQYIEAGGTAAGQCQNVWFIKMGPQGVHLLFGKGAGIRSNPWFLQQVASPDGAGKNVSFCTNYYGWIGSSMAQYHAVGMIGNINPTPTTAAGVTSYTNPFTDDQVSALYAKFPIGMAPDLCFVTKVGAASLQKSRAVTNFVSSGDRKFTQGIAPTADFPTSLPTMNGIPIVVTDSIQNGNQFIPS